MSVTLKDVAAAAGVSIKTVSNVVNGYGFVKEDNRQRVEAALAATGYRPNIGARNLRKGTTGFLALVIPELGIPYFGELASCVISAAREHGWNVLIEQTQGERDRERSALASLGPHFVDGAILSPEALLAADFAGLAPDFPLVLLGEHDVDLPVDRVAIDNVAAARAAVEHLIALGRTRIAAIGDNPRRGTATLRMRGYRDALSAAGLPVHAEYVQEAPAYHRRVGAEAMSRLLSLPEPPDAVFCFNDVLAIGALRAAAEAGRRVPDDVAVVGFDGTDESAFSVPALTTINPDKSAIARAAVDLIGPPGQARAARQAAEGVSAQREIQVPFALIPRESTEGR